MDRAPLGLKSQICESLQFHGLGDSYVKNIERISDDDTFFTEENWKQIFSVTMTSPSPPSTTFKIANFYWIDRFFFHC